MTPADMARRLNTEPLFDVPEPAKADPTAGMSYGRRLTWKQCRALEAGSHPLSLAPTIGYLSLHPGAAPWDDRTADGHRCGTCTFRSRTERGFKKCGFRNGTRATRGAATDLKSWWPACPDYRRADS